MVKVYKISGFLADPNDFLNEEEVRERLESLEDLFPSGIEIVEKEVENWEEASLEEIKEHFEEK